MDYFIRFASPLFLILAVISFVIGIVVHLLYSKGVYYRSTLATLALTFGFKSHHWYKKLFFVVRLIILAVLTFLVGKPQLVDALSKATTQGINIMITLDASGSMSVSDFDDDERSRFAVAKDEASQFIRNRPNDALGLVLFGKVAVSRCPLTLDRKMLETIIAQTELGVVDPQGTVLGRGIMAAINRLKNAPAKSNVMIVLTDGEPSPEDIDWNIAVEIAQQLKIKIYTVGIGGEQDRLINDRNYGPVYVKAVNKEILQSIAQKTGGRFFMAHNKQDMRDIYKAIDALEKSELEAPLFTRYYDIFIPGVWFVLLLLLFEIITSATIWFGL